MKPQCTSSSYRRTTPTGGRASFRNPQGVDGRSLSNEDPAASQYGDELAPEKGDANFGSVQAHASCFEGRDPAVVARWIPFVAMTNSLLASSLERNSSKRGFVLLPTHLAERPICRAPYQAQDDKLVSDRGIGTLAAYALAGLEENGRAHLVVTAPTGGSAGVMPAIVYGLGEGGRKLPQEKIREGMLAAAAIGYLCKHNATLSAAEGGCQAEIGIASAMATALSTTRRARRASPFR